MVEPTRVPPGRLGSGSPTHTRPEPGIGTKPGWVTRTRDLGYLPVTRPTLFGCLVTVAGLWWLLICCRAGFVSCLCTITPSTIPTALPSLLPLASPLTSAPRSSQTPVPFRSISPVTPPSLSACRLCCLRVDRHACLTDDTSPTRCCSL